MTNALKTQKILYSAIAKSMLGRYAVYATNLLSMMLLARLFTPELFGTVASIMVFFVFFQLIAEAGLGPAIINLDKLDPLDRDGLFGLTIILGLLMASAFYLMAPLFKFFYQLPRIDEVVPFVAASLFFFSLSILPNALLLRDQAFFRVANAGLAAEIASTALTAGLMQFIDPLHALAAKSTMSAATSFTVLYYFSSHTEFGQPKWGSKFSAIKPLLAYSAYQFGFNFINYFSRNLDNILVGKYLGAASLGIYDKAYQLMRYPLMLLTFAMTPAIQPVIRKYSDDPDKVEGIHRSFTLKLSLVGAAAGLSVFLLAEIIVRILLGPQWSGVTPIVKVLAISIPVQVVVATSGSFFQAMNRVDLLFMSGFSSAVIMISAIIWGVMQHDMVALSWALVIAFHVNFIQVYFVMYSKLYKKNMIRFFFNMTPGGLIILAMVLWG